MKPSSFKTHGSFGWGVLAQTVPPQGTATPGPDERSTEFRPVEGGSEIQSGEKLLVEAYAVIWVIVMICVLLSWRRQKRMDERIGDLETSLAKARRDAGAK